MHTRRISTFLLGAWIAGCLFMTFMTVQNINAPALVMDSPQPAAAKMIEKLGRDQAQLLFQHFAMEQVRHDFRLWERAELFLGLALGVCLFSATQKRLYPLLLVVIMLGLVLFEFKIVPELIYEGRITDFPPGSGEIGPVARTWAMEQVLIGAEIAKLIAGSVLASFLFFYRTPRRSRNDVYEVDHPHHSQINR